MKLIMRLNQRIINRIALFNSLQSLYSQAQFAPDYNREKLFYYGATESDTRIIAIANGYNYMFSSRSNMWFNRFYGYSRSWAQATKGKLLLDVSDFHQRG